MIIGSNTLFWRCAVSYTIGKSKHTAVRSRLATVLNWIGPATSFEFEVDQPLDSCAALLKAQEEPGLFARLFGRWPRVDITWEASGAYRFSMRGRRGNSSSINAWGSLKAVSSYSTQVRGWALDGSWFLLLLLL